MILIPVFIIIILLAALGSIDPTPINIILAILITAIIIFSFVWCESASDVIEKSFKLWNEKNHTEYDLYQQEKQGENKKNFFFRMFKEETKRISRKGETIPPDIEQNLFSTDPEQFFRNAEHLGYTIQLRRKKLSDDTQQES